MGLIKLINKVPKHFYRGIWDTLIIVALTIMPSIIVLLKLSFGSKKTDLGPMYKSGEFLLYSVSFLCAAFLVYNERTSGKKDWKSYMNSLIMVFLGLVYACYGILLAVENPNLYAIKIVSIAAICVSIPIFFNSQILNNKPTTIDIGQQRREESQEIEDALS